MRIYLHIVLFIVLILSTNGCSENAKEADGSLFISTEEIEVLGVGETKSVFIKTNKDWVVSCSETWCSINPSSGNKGGYNLTININENTTTEARSAIITVEAGDLIEQVNVNQQANSLLNLEVSNYSISSEGGDINISLKTSGDFTINILSDWLSQKNLKSVIDTSLVFIAETNDSYLKREGNIEFVLNGKKEIATITQEGIDVSITPDQSGVEKNAMSLASEIIVGWNLGNSLEVPTGETDWGNPKTTQNLINGIKNAGFNAVRIPCAWNSYIVNDETFEISESWLNRVKEVVDYCYNNNMFAIINIHWDGGWLEEHPLYAFQDDVNKKQYALWVQIAKFFRDYDEHLLFAGTNEVRENYSPPTTENITVQESFNQTFVDAVRATGGKNAYRNLIVQTYNTNITYGYQYHTMPVDQVENRLMAEVHYYDPWDFTGDTSNDFKSQWGSGYTDVSEWGQEDHLNEQFALVKEKYVDNDIPVILGEYGAILRSELSGDAYQNHVASRNYFLKTVTKAAIDNGMIPFIWDNGHTGNEGFGLFNRATGAQVHSDAIQAIMDGAQ